MSSSRSQEFSGRDDPRGDPEFERIFVGYLDELNLNGFVDPDQIRKDHPELAHAILEGLETYAQLHREENATTPLGVLGDYTLRRQIGRGGMGVVYEAWQNSLDRPVALKVLPAGVAADNRAFLRFMKEAKTAAQLNNRNVVQVYGVGVEQNTPYFAMELVEGETLAQVLARLRGAEGKEEEGRRILQGISGLLGKGDIAVSVTDVEPEGQVLGRKTSLGDLDLEYYAALAKTFSGVADGLQHAHSKGIIHRDIKPSNLILDGEGYLRILDFGLARLEGQEGLTISGDFVGTPQYMSPEQARRKKVPLDRRTDIYSLGATLYEMTTLQPPFRGKDHQDTLSQIIERDPIEPRKVNPRVPKDLETIVLKCLRKDAADRYGTAEALGQDLRRFARGDAIEARPQTRWEREMRRAWRMKGAIAVGLILVLAGSVLAGQLWSWRRERQIRLQERYDSLVRQAVLRLELVPAARGEEARMWAGWLDASTTDHLSTNAVHSATLALEDLDQAAVLFPERTDAQYHRARALLYLGRGQESRDALAALGHRAKAFVPASMLQWRLLELRADHESAAEAFQAAQLAADEPWEKAWIEIDRAWKDRDYKQAVKAYDKLLVASTPVEPFPGLVLAARMGRGSAWKALKDHARALQDFTIAGYLAPGALGPAIAEAEAMYFLEKEEEAEDLLKTVFDSTPWRDEAALAIASLYDRLGQKEKRLAWLDRIQDGSIRESEKAWRHYEAGRFKEAKTSACKAIELDPTNVDAYVTLAHIYFYFGPSELGVPVMEEGLKHRKASWTLLHYLGWTLNVAGRQAEGIARLEEASHLALNPGDDYSRIAQAYTELGDYAQGDEWARRAREADPGNPLLGRHRGYSLRLVGRLEEAFEAFSRVREEGYCEEYMYVVPFLQGRWNEALEILHRGQRRSDISGDLFVDAALIQARLGKPAEALEEIVKHLERAPAAGKSHRFVMKFFRENTKPLSTQTLDRLARALEKGCAQEARNPLLLNSLALVLAALPDVESREKAIRVALDGLDAAEVSGDLVTELRVTLRSILSEETPPGACPLSSLPRLPAYGGIDALFCDAALASTCGEPSASAAGLADDAISSRRGLYLRATILQSKGRHDEAEPLLRALVAQEPVRPEPLLRFSRVLRAQGKPEEAEEALHSALESAPERHRELWEAWIEVSFRDLHLSPTQLLERFPRVPAKRPPPPKEDFLATLEYAEAHADRTDCAEDARWLLEELSAGRSVRIRCGGHALTLPNGEVWGRDRFFLGGQRPTEKSSNIDIRGTDFDGLYWGARQFYGIDPEAEGYAIPVPPGRWRVHLHFAETEANWPGQRRFDVIVEDKVVLKDFEVLEKVPFRTAFEYAFETSVDEGPLEIRFSTGLQLLKAMISAIEVERAD